MKQEWDYDLQCLYCGYDLEECDTFQQFNAYLWISNGILYVQLTCPECLGKFVIECTSGTMQSHSEPRELPAFVDDDSIPLPGR